MARSSCPKCGQHSFELAENSPSGAKFKFYLVQCANYSCGAVVGVVDYYHVPTKIDGLIKVVEDNKAASSKQFENGMLQSMQVLFNNLNVLQKKVDGLVEKLTSLTPKSEHSE